MYKQKIREEMLSEVIRMVKRDLCKKYELIFVICIVLFIKVRRDYFGELEFVLSFICFIFYYLNMFISNMCVRINLFFICYC